MTKILKNDLNNSSIINMVSALNADKTNTENLISSISSFIDSSSNELKGESYNIMRNKASEYIVILKLRKSLADNLINAINSSCQNMNYFMEDYTELDNSNLENIISQYNQTYNNYIDAKNNLDTDLSNKSEIETNMVLKNDVAILESNLSYLYKLKSKLESLDSTDNQNYGLFENSKSLLSNYKSKTTSVNVSSIQI